jgi:hypothetical protein
MLSALVLLSLWIFYDGDPVVVLHNDVTMDFATVGLHQYKDFVLTSFPFTRKPILFKHFKNITIFITFIFSHKAVVKQDHYMTPFLNYANTVV